MRIKSFNTLILLVIPLCLMCAMLIGPRSLPGNVPFEFTSSDTNTYYQMVLYGVDVAIEPFAYRLGAPILISVAGLEPELGFFLLTSVSSITTGYLFYFFLKKIGFSIEVSLVTTMMLIFSYPIVFYLGAFGRVDPPANLLMVIMLLFTASKRYSWATLAICVGIMFRETSIILLPILLVDYILVHVEQQKSWHKLVTVISLMCIFTFGTVLIIRTLVEPSGTILGENGILGLIQRTISQQSNPIVAFAHAAWLAYGFFWFLIILGAITKLDKWTWYSIYLIIVSSGLVLIASDWHRMIGISFAGAFILIARSLSLYTSKKVYSILVILSAFQCWLVFIRFSELSPIVQTPYIISIVSTLIIGFTVAVFLFWKHQSTNTGIPQINS